MLTDSLKIDMKLAWEEWHRDKDVDPPQTIHVSYSQGYGSGVAALRWLLQEARPHIEAAEPSQARDRLLARLEDAGA